MACLAGPSFQEGKGSATAAEDAWPALEAEAVGVAEQPAKTSMKQNKTLNARRGFIPFISEQFD